MRSRYYFHESYCYVRPKQIRDRGQRVVAAEICRMSVQKLERNSVHHNSLNRQETHPAQGAGKEKKCDHGACADVTGK